ncbi:MAG: hypothetical protein IPI81_03520 [Flavobacteriales bacterium]|nr:hypothetical protein [Flavobacteriales bacterium]MCC6937694.1 hypothetical protein [Flavobacteriales bacterium]
MIKDRILRGWHAMRVLRAVFAVIFVFAAISSNEPVAWFAAAFFGIQAVFNIGCCGVDECQPSPSRRTNETGTEPIVYEEIR